MVRKYGAAPQVFYDVSTNGLFASSAYKVYGKIIVEEGNAKVGQMATLGLTDANQRSLPARRSASHCRAAMSGATGWSGPSPTATGMRLGRDGPRAGPAPAGLRYDRLVDDKDFRRLLAQRAALRPPMRNFADSGPLKTH